MRRSLIIHQAPGCPVSDKEVSRVTLAIGCEFKDIIIQGAYIHVRRDENVALDCAAQAGLHSCAVGYGVD